MNNHLHKTAFLVIISLLILSGVYTTSAVPVRYGSNITQVSDKESPFFFSGGRIQKYSSASVGNSQVFLPVIYKNQNTPTGPSMVTVGNGQGFDRCYLPTVDQMQTWWNHSPYNVFNIYLGGSLFFCPNDIPDETWVRAVASQGWKYILTWVGPQAPCSNFRIKMSSNTSTAYQEGRSEAEAAFVSAWLRGFKGDMVIYYDMEAYGSTASTSCRNAVDAFMRGWVERLHQLEVKAGGYGSPLSSHIADWANNNPPPDDVWIAHWLLPAAYNPNATVWTPFLSNDLWANHRRLRQYAGGHKENWGGVELAIDSNVLDGEVTYLPDLSPAPSQSFTAIPLLTKPQIQDMELLTQQAGWVLQDNRLLLTQDSGSSWIDRTPGGDHAAPVLAVDFIDPQLGWSLKPSALEGHLEALEIWRTVDGGENWESTTLSLGSGRSDQPLGAAYLHFSDASHGFLALKLQTGSSFSLGRLFVTEDGGLSWEERTLPLGEPVVFLDPERGWTAGGPAENLLFNTIDGGHTWKSQDVPIPDEFTFGQVYLGLPQFDQQGEGYLPATVVVDGKSTVLVFISADEGQNWQLQEEIPVKITSLPGNLLPFNLTPDGDWWVTTGIEMFRASSQQKAIPSPGTSLPAGVRDLDTLDGSSGWALIQNDRCHGDKSGLAENSPRETSFWCERSWALLATRDGGQSWSEITPN